MICAICFIEVNLHHTGPVVLKFEWSFEIYMSVLNIASEISNLLLSISKVGIFSRVLILFFFQLMHLVWKDFQRNFQDSMQMPYIAKKNSQKYM